MDGTGTMVAPRWCRGNYCCTMAGQPISLRCGPNTRTPGAGRAFVSVLGVRLEDGRDTGHDSAADHISAI